MRNQFFAVQNCTILTVDPQDSLYEKGAMAQESSRRLGEKAGLFYGRN